MLQVCNIYIFIYLECNGMNENILLVSQWWKENQYIFTDLPLSYICVR